MRREVDENIVLSWNIEFIVVPSSYAHAGYRVRRVTFVRIRPPVSGLDNHINMGIKSIGFDFEEEITIPIWNPVGDEVAGNSHLELAIPVFPIRNLLITPLVSQIVVPIGCSDLYERVLWCERATLRIGRARRAGNDTVLVLS